MAARDKRLTDATMLQCTDHLAGLVHARRMTAVRIGSKRYRTFVAAPSVRSRRRKERAGVDGYLPRVIQRDRFEVYVLGIHRHRHVDKIGPSQIGLLVRANHGSEIGIAHIPERLSHIIDIASAGESQRDLDVAAA